MLEKIKNMLGITGNYQDEIIQSYINEVKQFLIDGGVNEIIVNSEEAIGVIARGVTDLWGYGAGNTGLSPYFWQRATQLAEKEL